MFYRTIIAKQHNFILVLIVSFFQFQQIQFQVQLFWLLKARAQGNFLIPLITGINISLPNIKWVGLMHIIWFQ